jgi:hypothetical protein
MWFFILLGVLLVLVTLAGARQVVPHAIGLASIVGFFFCLFLAMLLGYRSRRIAIEERDRNSAGSMLVLMAGMLKDQDDATLERIVARGGPAADAAALLLERRRKG